MPNVVNLNVANINANTPANLLAAFQETKACLKGLMVEDGVAVGNIVGVYRNNVAPADRVEDAGSEIEKLSACKWYGERVAVQLPLIAAMVVDGERVQLEALKVTAVALVAEAIEGCTAAKEFLNDKLGAAPPPDDAAIGRYTKQLQDIEEQSDFRDISVNVQGLIEARKGLYELVTLNGGQDIDNKLRDKGDEFSSKLEVMRKVSSEAVARKTGGDAAAKHAARVAVVQKWNDFIGEIEGNFVTQENRVQVIAHMQPQISPLLGRCECKMLEEHPECLPGKTLATSLLHLHALVPVEQQPKAMDDYIAVQVKLGGCY